MFVCACARACVRERHRPRKRQESREDREQASVDRRTTKGTRSDRCSKNNNKVPQGTDGQQTESGQDMEGKSCNDQED